MDPRDDFRDTGLPSDKTNKMETLTDKQGSGSTYGFRYQIKLLLMFLLRGVHHFKKFKMATEINQKHVGKFDDVVFQYTNENSEERYILLQAKHSSDETKKINMATLSSPKKDNEFSLVKYFHSYLCNIRTNKGIGIVESLVLLTNQRVDSKVMEHKEVKKHIEVMEHGTEQTDGVEQLRNIITKGTLYTFSETFMNEVIDLGPKVINYHSKVMAKKLLTDIRHGKIKTIILSWKGSDIERVESAIYTSVFEFDTGEDKKHLIKGLKRSFIMNETCKQFRNALVEEFKCSLNIFSEKINLMNDKINKNITDMEKNIGRTLSEKEPLYYIIAIHTFLQTAGMYLEGDVVEPEPNIKISEESVKDFSKLLILAVEQPHVEEIDSLIKDVLQEYKVFHKPSIDLAVNHLINRVNSWFDAKGGHILNEHNCNGLLINAYLEIMSLQYVTNNYIHDNICFLPKCLNYLHAAIELSDVVHITSQRDSLKLLITKLCQLKDKRNYLYLDFNVVGDRLTEDVNINFLNVSNPYDAVVIDNLNCNAADITKSISTVKRIHEKTKIKIILITCHDEVNITKEIRNKFHSLRFFRHRFEKITFTQLSESSRDYVLSKKIINFQGNDCSYKDILGNESNYESIDSKTMCELIMTKEKITIGERPHSLTELPAAWTTLFQPIDLNLFINLLSNASCKFAVSGNSANTKESLLKLCEPNQQTINENIKKGNIITFDDTSDGRNEFRNICKDFSSGCVMYWIKVQDGALFLHQVFNPNFYIQRQLQYVTSVEIPHTKMLQALNKSEGMKLIVSNVPNNEALLEILECKKEELDKWISGGIIELTSEGDAHQQFESPVSKKLTVHWIQMQDGRLEWKQTFGSLDLIRESKHYTETCETELEQHKETEFDSKLNNRLIIISDVAGMGKSTTLTSMCRTNEESRRWIIRINFKDIPVHDVLRKHEDKLSSPIPPAADTLVSILSDVRRLNLDSHLPIHIFKYLVTLESNKLTFILDGFDEVPLDIQTAAAGLLQSLVENTTCIIHLATRPHFAASLEDKYLVLSTKLREIPFEEQCEFLVNFWNIHTALSKQITTEQLQGMAKDFINKLSGVVGVSLGSKGIPLHSRIIAEFSLPHVIENSIGEFFTRNMNIKSIYEQFCRTKYDIFFKEKNVVHCPSFVKISHEHYTKVHSEFAFQLFFPHYFKAMDVDIAREIKENERDYMLIGMLQRTGESYEFIHRTLCEYYCAAFLERSLQNQRTNETFYKIALDVLQKELFRPDRSNPYKLLRMFVDAMLVVELPLHNGLFNRIDVLPFLTKQSLEQSTVDILGRTALHLAAQYAGEHIIAALLCFGWDASLPDVTGKTPLHYAARYCPDNVKVLVKACVDVDIHLNIDKSLDEYDGVADNVFLNDQRSQSKLFRIINSRDIQGHTCLFYAVDSEAWDSCVLLIRHGAIIHNLSDAQVAEIINTTYRAEATLALLIRRNPMAIQNIADKKLYKVLKYLSIAGYISTIEYLLSLDILNNPVQVIESYLDSLTFEKPDENLSDALKIIFERINAFSGGTVINQDFHKTINEILSEVAVHGYIETYKCITGYMGNNKNGGLDLVRHMEEAIRDDHVNIVEYIYTKMYQVPTTLEHDAGNGQLRKYYCRDLMYAASMGKLRCVKYLWGNVQHAGGDVGIVDCNGYTVLDHALSVELYGREDYLDKYSCVEYLVKDCKATTRKYESHREYIEQIIQASYESVKEGQKNLETEGGIVNETTLLHKAVDMGSEILVRRLLALGADVNARNSEGRTPLECMEDPSSLSCFLLQNGARYNSSTQCFVWSTDCYCSIDITISDGYELDIFKNEPPFNREKELIAYIMHRIHSLDSKSQTLIHEAARDYKAMSLIFKLVPQNNISLDISIQDANGDSPLHIAARGGNIDVVRLLLKRGAVYDSVNNDGDTPEMCCTGNNDIVSLLQQVHRDFLHVKQNNYRIVINEKLIVNIRDKDGRSALHWAVSHGNDALVQYLLKMRADVNATDNDLQTPLHYAATKRSTNIICDLLTHGAVYNCRDKCNKMPSNLHTDNSNHNFIDYIDKLFHSVQNGQLGESLSLIETLEGYNGNVASAAANARDERGNTLLHYAAKQDYIEVVHFVLRNGGMYNRRNSANKSPVDLVNIKYSNTYVLLQNIDSLLYSIDYDLSYFERDPEARKCLLNTIEDDGGRLLHYVEDSYVINWFVRHSGRGVDEDVDKEGRTPLMRAVERYDLIIVKALCEEGADVNKRAYNGDSVLHIAVERGDLTCVGYLVERGADVSVNNHEGHTPVDMAVSLRGNEYSRIADYLTHIKPPA